MKAPSPRVAVNWHARDREAVLIAQLLRDARLTVLHGAPGAGKTTLLKAGVLPLLRRRVGDRKPLKPGEPRVVLPFPDRRGTDGYAAEVAIVFDRWTGAPLAALRRQLFQALPIGRGRMNLPRRSLVDALAAWSKELSVRFLIIFDHFDEYLAAPLDRAGILEFADQFEQGVSEPLLPANFLLSLRDEGLLLARFQERIAGLGNASLQVPPLPHVSARRGPPQDRAVSHPAAITAAPPPPAAEAPEASRVEQSAAPAAEPFAAPAAAEAADASRVEQSGAPAAEQVAAPAAPEAPVAPRVEQFVALPAEPFATPAAAEAADAPRVERFATPAAAEAADAPRVERSAAPAAEQVAMPAAAEAPGAPRVEQFAALPAEQTAAPPAAGILLRSPPAPRSTSMPVLKSMAISVGLASLLVLGATVLEPTGEQGSRQPPTQAAADAEAIAVADAEPIAPVPSVPPTAPEVPPAHAAADAEPIAPVPSVPPTAPEVPPALPRVALVTEVGNSTDERIAHDLSRIVAADAGIGLVATAAASSDVTPLFAIVRYDAVQAARNGATTARQAVDRWRIVSPLYNEEIHFVARRDAPLAFIHDIREARINLGPAQSSRSQTIALLYERMFDTSIPDANASFLGDEDALTKLVVDKTIDAIAVVAGQPDRWLADLKPQLRQSVKLLKLDQEHPASRRAMEVYSPAVVRAASYRAWLDEDTRTLAVRSFLVTSDYTDKASFDRIRVFAGSLCRNLPVLQRDGHPKWREVRPDLGLEVGLPYSAPAFAAFYSCRAENLRKR
jgi:uncharacterized protein